MENKIEEIIDRNDDYLVTESTIEKTVSHEELSKLLKDRKTTASINIRVLQGGTASITVVEKTKLTESQREKVREILGMELK